MPTSDLALQFCNPKGKRSLLVFIDCVNALLLAQKKVDDLMMNLMIMNERGERKIKN